MKRDLLGSVVRVSQFVGPNGSVRNHFLIRTTKGLVFQSYQTIIAAEIEGKIYLDRDKWDYSRTTGKYRNLFLHETKRETEQRIEAGEYILTDLNTEEGRKCTRK